MSDSKYYSNFEGLEENSVNVKLIPLYNGLTNMRVDYELPILCQIMTGQKSKSIERKPLNIAVVLDRSGSMIGEKLDKCKSAILTMIDNLVDDDMLSFITYDDRVNVVFENLRRSAISKDLVTSVTCGGSTNISGGLEAGVASLKKSESVNTNVVFLFSDGNANAGNTNLNEVREMCKTFYNEDGIHFTTYGIGSDFNENWLKGIASSGHGSYFYIDTENRDEELTTSLLRKGFIEFSRNVAKNVSIKFRPVGSTLVSVKGSKDFLKMVEPVAISKLSERELVQFMVTVKPDVVTIADVEVPKSILNAQIEYYNDDDEKHIISTSCEMPVSEVIAYNMDAKVYQTVSECGELELQANEYLKMGNVISAKEVEEKVIKKYEEMLEFDRFGLLDKLLVKSRETLHVMNTESDIGRISKVQGYNAGYAMAQHNASEEDEEESAGGAGGMFDDDDDDW